MKRNFIMRLLLKLRLVVIDTDPPNIFIKPKWYGIAWVNDYGFSRYLCPIPFNIIVNIFLNIYWWAVFFGGRNMKNKILIKVFKDGKQAGYSEAVNQFGVKHNFEEKDENYDVTNSK